MKFSPELDAKVDFSSIKIDAVKPWITARFVLIHNCLRMLR